MAQLLLQMMHDAKLSNPKLSRPEQVDELFSLCEQDIERVGAVIDYVAEREHATGNGIHSPVAYAISVVKRSPDRFKPKPQPISVPELPTPKRPSFDEVRAVIERGEPL